MHTAMNTSPATAILLAASLCLCAPACLLEFSDGVGQGCERGHPDYPECLPIDMGEPPPTEEDTGGGDEVGEGPEDSAGVDGDILVRRLDYWGPDCAGGEGVRVIVGHDNDGDGLLNTEIDGHRCVTLGDVFEGGVGVALCLDEETCLSWGVEFDLDSGVGVRLCAGEETCLALGVTWSDELGKTRLCWDPQSDASVPADEILHEEIVCLEPSPCGDLDECEADLACRDGLCVWDEGEGGEGEGGEGESDAAPEPNEDF